MPELARAALALTVRRFPLYAAVVTAAILLEALVVFSGRFAAGFAIANDLVVPIVVAIAYAFTAADAAANRDARSVWLRILERAWAVIVIDFVLDFITESAIASVKQGGLLDLLMGSLTQLLAATLVFVDVAAVLDDDDNWLLLVPRAFGRGIALAWQPGNLWRCFVIYSLQFVVFAIGVAVLALFERFGIRGGTFWAFLALGTVLAPPISAFTVLVYFDAAGIDTTALAANDTVQ
jgi:hypothetical protein